MNANEAKKAFGELAVLVKAAMDAETAQTKKDRAQFARSSGRSDDDDTQERLKTELVVKAMILGEGFIVNIARIADALEKANEPQPLLTREREKL